MARRVRVFLRGTPPSRSAPTDTGVAFLAAITYKGALDTTQPVKSLDDFIQHYGDRQSYSVGYDWVETFFREGGSTLWVSPVRGPNPVIASLNLTGTSGTTLVVSAKDAGDWANGATGGLSAEVVNGPSGASYRQIIIRLNGVEVERTPEFTDRADAIAWSTSTSEYVTITAGGGTASLPIVAASANLTAGTLDRTNITQTQIDAALALMVRDLGPGQVAAPDWQTSATHTSLLAHAAAMNRYALLDPTDTTSKSTLLTAAALVQGNVNGDYGSLVAPWLTISGIAGGATRSVPLSAFIAAKSAQTDAAAGPNQAPAGPYGKATSSLILSAKATFSDTDQLDLETAGVGLAVTQFGGVVFDTNRTLVEPLGSENEWLQMSTSRYRMSLVARAEAAALSFAHLRITQTTIAALDTVLTGILMLDEINDWLLLLPGETPGSSYIVETGDPVNTPETIAGDELNASVAFRPAPGADFVNIYLTKVAASDPVAA